jgi:hypothetical protein
MPDNKSIGVNMKYLYICLIYLISINEMNAWIYPEHRDIALLAVQKLSSQYRQDLDKLWAEARRGHEERLTISVIDATQSQKAEQLDFAAWPAIAGDHSCSPKNLLYNVLESKWLIKVANIAAELKIEIAEAKNRSDLINALRDSDIKFQRVDLDYATRAGSNNVHFLLARPDVDTDTKEYLEACLKRGVEINALGAFAWFHLSAIAKAQRYALREHTPQDSSNLILSALADEGFALHFLEDVFASGHAAGTWGDASQRKGTHDYYNEHGIEVVTWDGKRMILTGDAFMRLEDAQNASETIKLSLEQFIDAATGKLQYNFKEDSQGLSSQPDTLNVCRNDFIPERKVDKSIFPHLLPIFLKTPVPGLATGLGELPRFRSELGMFLGVVAAMRGYTVHGGYGESQNSPGFVGGIDVNVRIGLGIDGVLNESGDGQVFFDVGKRRDSPTTSRFSESEAPAGTGQITAAIPGRDAFNFRIRMPFYLLPFDLLITAPILVWAAPDVFQSMAVISANGGLIPWQSGIATPIGRFQFMLGREIGASLYGSGEQKDGLLMPIDDSIYLISMKSIQFDFPILEYRPFRHFTLDQSSDLLLQIMFGVDIPYSYSIEAPDNAPAPVLKPVWFVGMRLAFNWRSYF